MSRYRNEAIRRLKDEHLRSVPVELRLERVERAEHLLNELDPLHEYRVTDLKRQITSGRQKRSDRTTIRGEDALHDLRLFVEDVSDSADIAADSAGEPVYKVEDVSRRFNVSTKTVERWRDRGLVSRRFKFGNRKQVGFLESTLKRFAAHHADEVERGRRFSQMTDDERDEILRQARWMAQSGATPGATARELAKKFDRSTEAIRYTIRNHDRENPEEAVFPHASMPLTEEMREEIYRRHRRGTLVKRLAADYYRSQSEIERIARKQRVKKLWDEPIEFVYNEEFEAPNAEAEILGSVPEGTARKSTMKAPAGLPPYLASLYEVPLLTKEQEQHYFRKMNYLKFEAARLRDSLDPEKATARDLDRIESLLQQATDVRNLLIRRNLRLVVSIAKKYVKNGSSLFEMISDGNISLMRAIDKFDYGRGFKLSTYATWAIRKNFARSIPAEYTQLERFRTGHDEYFQNTRTERTDQFSQEQTNRLQHEVLKDILSGLGERERNILVVRYGLERGTEPQTLEQVGRRFGVTKERIRQLEARALRKLREIAEQENLDIPGIR